MKKVGKVLLLTGLATMVIGTIGIVNNVTNMQSEDRIATIQAYNPTPANMLENVFVLDNNKYLPIIPNFDQTETGISVDIIREQFGKANLSIARIEHYNTSLGIVTTGTTVTVAGSSEVYTIVIYGDVVGNGLVGSSDAVEIIDYWLEGGDDSGRISGQAYKLAANVYNNNGEIDSSDAVSIIDYWVGNIQDLVLIPPTPTKPVDPPTPGDTQAPTITIGNAVKTVNFGEQYDDNDNDVTANDNVDGDITSKVRREKIEFIPAGGSKESANAITTDKIGTYIITYKVSDNSGNSTTEVRTVTVLGLSKIEIGNGTQQQDLNLYITVPTQNPTGSIRIKEDLTDHNVYTILPIKFYNQNNANIDVKAVDIKMNIANSVEGKLGIDLANVNTTGNEAILVKYYDANGNEINKNDTTKNVKEIGFAMSLNGQTKADISQLNGKVIKLNCRNQATNLTVAVNYKPLQNLVVDTQAEGTTLGTNADGSFIARIGEPFVLAVVEPGELEELITQEMIDQGIVSFKEQADFSDSTIQMDYVIEQGRVLLKGTIHDEGPYTITLTINGIERTSFRIKGVNIAKELTVSLGNKKEFTLELLNGDEIYEKLIVGSASGPQEVQLKDIDVVQIEEIINPDSGEKTEQIVQYLNVIFCDERGIEIDTKNDPGAINKVVGNISMTINNSVTSKLPVDVIVTITLYDNIKGIGCEESVLVHIK